MRKINHLIALSLVTFSFLSALFLAPIAIAQVGPGDDALLQNGQIVGYIWVPERAAEACEYKEIWYLFSDYVYPSKEHPVETTIVVAPEPHFTSESEFRKAMTISHPGGHFVVTVAIEEREDCR